MVRLLVNAAVYMGAAAIGLLLADAVLDRLSIAYPIGFVIATVVFGVIQAVITPLVEKVTQKQAAVLTGVVGLISAALALLVTAAVSDALSIDGPLTWVLAALVIWLASMLAAVILRLTVAKKYTAEVRD